jgi:hypothetical protein
LPYRIDGFAIRPGGHQHALAAQVLDAYAALDFGDQDLRVGQAAFAFPPTGEKAIVGLDDTEAVRPQPAYIGLHQRILPHVDVHRRCQHDRRADCEEHGGDHIVSDADGKLADDVGGRRRDHDRVGTVGKANVADRRFLAEVEGVRHYRMPGECLQCQRGDEALRTPTHHDADAGAGFHQLADQLGALVAGNAAGQAEDDDLAVKPLCHRPRTTVRFVPSSCPLASASITQPPRRRQPA